MNSKQSIHLNQQGGMEIRMDEGMKDDLDNDIDLSQYGGTKPEFYIKEQDDNNVIENMNSKLLGLQSGGEKDTLDFAKQQGINNILSENHMQNGGGNMRGGQGLNMSYNNTNQNMQQMHKPMANMQQHSMNQMQQNPNTNNSIMTGGGSMNMQNSNNPNTNPNNINFNSNIKVVELDTKVSDGYFYSGSKNLDPFRK